MIPKEVLAPTVRVGKKYRNNLQVLECNDLACAIKQVKVLYQRAYHIRKSMIDFDMKQMYGRPIRFKECETTDMEIAIKDLIHSSGKSMEEINYTICHYMRDKLCMFRQAGDKRVPIELSRIKQAYFAALNRDGRKVVEDILYKE